MLTLFISNTALAEKPEWAGKGKPTKEQLKAHKESMKAKKGVNGEYKKLEECEKAKDKKKSKIKEDKHKSKGASDKKKNLKSNKDKTTETKSKKVKSEVQVKTDKDKSTEKAKEVRKKWWQLF